MIISIVISGFCAYGTWDLSNYSTYGRVKMAINFILMYKILFLLKRVELQINPKYKTTDEILKILTKMIRTERLYLGL